MKNNNNISDSQLSLFDDLFETLKNNEKSISSKDLKTAIKSLQKAYNNAEKREEKERKKKLEEERKERERIEEEKRQAHYFRENKKAIEKVLPNTVSTKDIYITLGSPWVPTDIIEDFIDYLLGINYLVDRSLPRVTHDEITGTWQILNKSTYKGSVASKSTYGTSKLEAIYIIEKTLNMKSVAVMDKVYCPQNKSGEKRVINKSETLLAVEKQNKIIKEFQGWVWRNAVRKERLEIIFENQYSCVRKRNFDGSFLTFPNLSPAVNLYPYQKNAVARILFSPNTLLAHDVGAGKTYVMIAAGMELQRMGLSKKNLYVVPNNIIQIWVCCPVSGNERL